MRTITIELSPESCSAALRELEEYRNKLKSALDEICKRVAEFGLTKAEVYFEQAPYDGTKDFRLDVKQIKNGYSLIANGKTVLFLEFGAGVHYPNDHPKAGEMGVAHGTYGKGLGKNDWWFYTGQPGTAGGELAHGHKNTTITHGNPASMPMYKSSKEMRAEIKRIAEEVLRRL